MASSVRAREANRSVGSPGQARLGARGGVRGSWEGLRGLLASGRLARLDGGTKNAASWRRQGSREFPPNRLAPPRVSQIRFARGPICVSPAFRPVAAWGGGTAWAGDTARRDIRAGISVGDLLELLSFEAAAEAAASLTLPLWEEVPVGGRNGCSITHAPRRAIDGPDTGAGTSRAAVSQRCGSARPDTCWPATVSRRCSNKSTIVPRAALYPSHGEAVSTSDAKAAGRTPSGVLLQPEVPTVQVPPRACIPCMDADGDYSETTNMGSAEETIDAPRGCSTALATAAVHYA
ncbi:hypothetical protein ACCO45_005544 [Purpureocillium lilacinum]|uniref:Uncharacterized protein n=1 Tax=Purpureocillium lilacinum TaxID=33203 RepID=A0ACC4DVR3_PURLI